MIKNIAVCDIGDLYFFAEGQGIAGWNDIQDCIYWQKPDISANHRHWYLDTFVITENFFNPEYQEDAYGLNWHPKVREMVQKFMEHHKLKKFVVCTTKNQSLSEL